MHPPSDLDTDLMTDLIADSVSDPVSYPVTNAVTDIAYVFTYLLTDIRYRHMHMTALAIFAVNAYISIFVTSAYVYSCAQNQNVGGKSNFPIERFFRFIRLILLSYHSAGMLTGAAVYLLSTFMPVIE